MHLGMEQYKSKISVSVDDEIRIGKTLYKKIYVLHTIKTDLQRTMGA